MSDGEKTPVGDIERLQELAEWVQSDDEEETPDPRETFRQASHIALCMSYDMIDKLRFWERETLKLTDEEIQERLPHMATFLERLKNAYLDFSDVDF